MTGWKVGATGIAVCAMLVGASALGGCSSKSKNAAGSSSAASTASAASKQPPPSSAFLDVLGEDGLSRLGMLDGPRESALFGAVAPHTDVEPSYFSAGWIGVEAAEVLRRARTGEFANTTVTTPARTCLIFHDNGMVRRLMTNDAIESHEYAMSAKGNILLWLRAIRNKDQTRQLAFFHQGKDLKLYQAWEGNGARRTEAPPNGLRDYIFSEAKDCFNAFHAKNPAPGVGATVEAPPPPPPPPPPPAKVENSHSFKVDAVSFRQGDSIQVTMGEALVPPPGNQFWITMVPANSPDSTFGEWHYLPSGATADSFTAKEPGDYEIRLHDAFPTFSYRVMARQRISVTAVQPKAEDANEGDCAHASAPGTFCKLDTGFRGYCELVAGTCVDQCPEGMGLGPDGACYPAAPANGECGDGCIVEWQVCVCPPGD
ncbi:MAG: hypothetical protein U0414_13785 [Polyangiaceae bacterium]